MADRRERCDRCPGRKHSAVGFTVPDEVWQRVTGGYYDVLCIACFAAMADGLNVPWDNEIEFWPVSLVTVEAHDASSVLDDVARARGANKPPTPFRGFA